MLGTLLNSPLSFLASLISIVAAISIHEFFHAWTADRLGDPTPRLQGRLTLNPRAHLDLVGTITLLLFRFGWGKPVMFDPFNLKNPRRDAMLISLAGPGSNLTSAAIAALAIRLIGQIGPISLILVPFIIISVSLALFNLIPVHPLDGGKIITGLLPRDLAYEWEQIQKRWGLILLIFLIFPWTGGTAPVFYLIGPVINFLLNLFLGQIGGIV